MIVDKFDVVGVVFLPAETETPLAIDPDAELASPIAFKGLQTISRR